MNEAGERKSTSTHTGSTRGSIPAVGRRNALAASALDVAAFGVGKASAIAVTVLTWLRDGRFIRGRPTTMHPAPAPGWDEVQEETRQRFRRLLDLQFWYLGRDIEHPDGNLLRRLGFIREPGSSPGRPSRYTRSETDGHVVIWPCGMLFVADDRQCLLLRGCVPALVANERLRDMSDPGELLAELERGSACPGPALAHASRWFARYENTVDSFVGIGRREPRPGTAPALAPPRPCSLAHQWSALAADLEALEPAALLSSRPARGGRRVLAH